MGAHFTAFSGLGRGIVNHKPRSLPLNKLFASTECNTTGRGAGPGAWHSGKQPKGEPREERAKGMWLLGYLPADRLWGAVEMIVAEAGGWEVSHYLSLVLILTLM